MRLASVCRVALILSILAPFDLKAGEILAGIKPGQRLEVWFGSSGCFHRERYFFLFQDKGVSISRVVEGEKGDQVKKRMGHLDLTDEEIGSIDRMFVRYRNASDSGSTSTEALSVEVWEKDKRISKEVLIDGRPVYVGRAEGEIRLWDLIERVQEGG